MMWTPAKLPPHPSTIPILSPLAQLVLDRLKDEMNQSEHVQPQLSSYQTAVCKPNQSNKYNHFLVGQNDGAYSSGKGDVYGHRIQRSEGSTKSKNRHFLDCPETRSNFCYDKVDGGIFSNMVAQSSYRENNMFQQNNNHSLINSNNNGFCNIHTNPSFVSQHISSTVVPSDFVNKPTLQVFDELSPNMEFEDMEVYSFPQGGVIINPNNHSQQDTIVQRQMAAPELHPSQSYKERLLHLKEIQPGISQSRKKCFQNKVHKPKIFDISNLEPSDQTFIFSDKRSSPTYKSRSEIFPTKNISSKTKTLLLSYSKKQNAPTNLLTDTYHDRICDREIIRIPNREQIPKSKEENISCCGRERIDNKIVDRCSYEISDLSLENTMKKYYENSQVFSQVSILPKSINSERIANLESGSRTCIDINTNSQPELSENCESLFTKTQDYDANYEDCLINENLPSRSLKNMPLTDNFDIDDLFSPTDGPCNTNFECHKPNLVAIKRLNDKQVVPEKNVSSMILKKEMYTCRPLQQTNNNNNVPGVNFNENKSSQNVFANISEQKNDKEINRDSIAVAHKFCKENSEQNNCNILPENLTKPFQETKINDKLSNEFDVEDLFKLQNETQSNTLHKLKPNFCSNRNKLNEEKTLTQHRTVPHYSKNIFNTLETETYTKELVTLSDCSQEENIFTANQNKATKIEGEYDKHPMCTTKFMTHDTTLIGVKENKTQNGDKRKFKNMKLYETSVTDISDGLDKENNAKDAFTLLFESSDKPLNQKVRKQEEVLSEYFQNPKIPSYKNNAKINKDTKSDNERGLCELKHEDLNSQKLQSKEFENVITTSNYLPTRVNKKMKQATIYDCKKFFPPLSREGITTKADSQNHSSNNTKSCLKFDNFKKPQPLNKKSNGSTICTIKQRDIKTVKFDNKTQSKQDMDIPSVHVQNNDYQSNYLETNVENKSTPSKMVQTSFVKTQSNKRTWSSDSTKTKKKPRFTAPVMVSHSTSKATALKNYTITVLDDVSANEIVQKLSVELLSKLVITVTFKEGYTLLNKPENPMKNSRCCPSGIMFMAFWGSNKTDFYWLQLIHVEITQAVQCLIQELFTKSSRVVCFEAQAVFMLLMDVFRSKNISNWYAYDPLIGCWLLDPDNPPKDFVEVVSKLDVDRNLLVVNPKADVKTQACDLLPVLDVAMVVLEQGLANASLLTLFSDMEMKLTPLLAVMELSSILVDVRKLHETAGVLEKRLKELQKEAHSLAGRSFQLNSHQQLRQILYDELKLDEKFNVSVKQTEQGSKSTSEAVLLQFHNFHPLPKIVLEFRQLQKVKSTYVDGLIQFVKQDGTIGSVWEQVGAATGRITSKNPNLQAIPKVTVQLQGGESIYLRAVFKAREGFTFLAADFQQIEFRVFAHYTKDNTLLQAFRKGGDIFQELAGLWLGGTGPVEREKTKRIVYSVMYGAGPLKLAEYLQVPVSEASTIITSFVDKFPCLRSLPRTVVAQCRARGYIVTLSGRRRLFPNIRSTNYKLRAYSERQAINFLIQGSAADICKAAMLDCDADLKCEGLDAKLLLQIHDELVWEVADSQVQRTAQLVRRAMEQHWGERLALVVPVPVCVSCGKTLADMQPLVPATMP